MSAAVSAAYADEARGCVDRTAERRQVHPF